MTTEARRSVGPLVALGLAVAIVIAAVAVALIGGDDVSATAVRVNSSEVSQKTFNAQLRSIASAEVVTHGTATDSFVPSSAAAQLASFHVVAMLWQADLDRHGVHVSQSDRQQFERQNAEQLKPYSSSGRDFVVDYSMLQSTWTAKLGGSNPSQALARLIRHADIHVDPRYGYWSRARGQVCPPTGCGASSAATGG